MRLAVAALTTAFCAASEAEKPVWTESRAPLSLLRTTGLLAVPNGDVVAHGQYRILGSLQFFSASRFSVDESGDADTAESRQFNYGTEVLFGLENRAEFGLYYGQDLALSFKALLLEEDSFWPNLAFGIRSLFGSAEADLYGVSDHLTLRSVRGESYLVAAKTFAGNTRLHGGASVMNGANKSLASMNFGLEQNLGAGAFLGYELFERFSDFHQDVSLTWRFGPAFAMHIALTELQSWVRQKGEWGFFLSPAHAQKSGYNAPGIRFAMQVNGFMPRIPRKTLAERVDDLEAKSRDDEEKMQRMQGQLVKLRLEASARLPAAPTQAAPAIPVDSSSRSAPPEDPRVGLSKWLDSLGAVISSPLANPQAMTRLLSRVDQWPPTAKPFFAGVALDSARPQAQRLAAIMAMGHTKDSALVAPLKLVCGDKDPRIRREALTALGRIGHPSALDIAKKLMSDPDVSVSLTAEELVSNLLPKPKPGLKTKSEAQPASKVKPEVKPPADSH